MEFGAVQSWITLHQAGTPATRSKRLFGKTLVAMQVALSVLLVSVGALFVTNLWNLEHTHLGFQRDHVLLATLDTSASGYTKPQLYHDYQEALTRLSAIPGVHEVSLCAPTPLSGAGASGFVNVEGYQERPSDKRWIEISYASPKYFETIGIPLLRGRSFTSQDQLRPRVAVINQTFARHYFNSRDPIGKHITMYHVTLDPTPKTYEIIGVVADAHYAEIREPAKRGIYLPAFHDGFVSANSFAIRSNRHPEDIASDVRTVIQKVMGPGAPILLMTTLSDQIDASIVTQRLIATLSGFFAALGALLVGIGIYGLLTYTVARRTNEIGIRIALGATAAHVKRIVLVDTLTIILAGLAVGTPLAIAGRRLAVQLVGLTVEATIPLSTAAVILTVIALIASYVPVGRAARVDPIQALRHE